MAEILVFAVDRVSDDVYQNAKLFKRGDVLHVAQDGWSWGVDELNSHEFRVISLPKLSVKDLQPFLSPEIPTTPMPINATVADLNNTLQLRGQKFNLDDPSLPISLKDTSRVLPITTHDIADITPLKITKPVIADPAIIGTSDTLLS